MKIINCVLHRVHRNNDILFTFPRCKPILDLVIIIYNNILFVIMLYNIQKTIITIKWYKDV